MGSSKIAHPIPAAQVTALRDRLLAWYAACRRDLPWRKTRDPYSIWVSEVMLQQTRVETVIPYYERFLAAYPTVAALAEAPLDEVLGRWSGLGYYRRARTLHAAAKQVHDEMRGTLPRTADELRAIRGIGPYTAGAIASIAFDEAAPLVDGNVARVLARLFAVEEDVTSSAGNARLWAIAGALVPQTQPGDFNQALMELGATVCTPRAPRCLVCPVRAACAAFSEGRVEELPKKAARAKVATWKRVAVVARRGERVLLARRSRDGLFGGMWEPPMVDGATWDAARFESVTRATWTETRVAGSVTHVLSHRRMEITVVSAQVKSLPKLVERGEYDALELVPWPLDASRGTSTLALRILAAAGLSVSSKKTTRK